MLELKGHYTFLPSSMEPPQLAHSRQPIDMYWIKGKMNAWCVTKPFIRCDWYKTKWHSPCLHGVQPNGKERPENYRNSISWILLVAMLRPFGDTGWSLENGTKEVECHAVHVQKRRVREYWEDQESFLEKSGLWAASQTMPNISSFYKERIAMWTEAERGSWWFCPHLSVPPWWWW